MGSTLNFLWEEEERNKESEKIIPKKSESSTYEEYIESAIKLYSKGRHEESILELSKAISMNQERSGAYKNRGSIFLEMGKIEEALQDFDRSIQINPRDLESMVLRLRIISARPDLSPSINEKTFESEKYYCLAIEKTTKGKCLESIILLNESIRLNPKDWRPVCLRGQLYFTLNDYGKSIQDCSECVELCSNGEIHPFLLHLRGILNYEYIEDYEFALNDFSEIIRTNKDHKIMQEETLFNRASTFEKLDRTEESIKDFSSVVQINPFNGRAFYRRAKNHLKLMKYEDALQDFGNVLELDSPTEVKYEVFQTRGKIYVFLKNFEDSLREFSQAIEVFPERIESFQLYYVEACILLKLQRYEEAVEMFSNALKAEKKISGNITPIPGFIIKSHIVRGQMMYSANRFEEALHDFRQLMVLDKEGKYGEWGVLCNSLRSQIKLVCKEKENEITDFKDFVNVMKHLPQPKERRRTNSHLFANVALLLAATGNHQDAEILLKGAQDTCLEEDLPFMTHMSSGIHRVYDKVRSLEELSRFSTHKQYYGDQEEKIHVERVVRSEGIPIPIVAYDTHRIRREEEDLKKKGWKQDFVENIIDELKIDLKGTKIWYMFERDEKRDESVEKLEIDDLSNRLETMEREGKGIIGNKNFEILKFIGGGCVGKAFLARIKGFQWILVMKFFSKEMNQRSWEFMKSKEAVKVPYHRNVVSLLYSSKKVENVDVENFPEEKIWRKGRVNRNREILKTGILVMKFYRKDLDQYISQRRNSNAPFSNYETCLMMKGMMSGVYHLFQNKIIHRDLHSKNVFVDESYGRIWIGDLGCCMDLKNNTFFGENQWYKVRLKDEILYSFNSYGERQSTVDGGYGVGHIPPEIRNTILFSDDENEEEYLNYEKCDLYSVGLICKELISIIVSERKEETENDNEEVDEETEGEDEKNQGVEPIYQSINRLWGILISGMLEEKIDQRKSYEEVLKCLDGWVMQFSFEKE